MEKTLEKIRLTTERCKGCGYCVSVCPKGALTMTNEINDKGYNFPAVDQEKCIQCSMCYRVCPDYVFEILKKEAK